MWDVKTCTSYEVICDTKQTEIATIELIQLSDEHFGCIFIFTWGVLAIGHW